MFVFWFVIRELWMMNDSVKMLPVKTFSPWTGRCEIHHDTESLWKLFHERLNDANKSALHEQFHPARARTRHQMKFASCACN